MGSRIEGPPKKPSVIIRLLTGSRLGDASVKTPPAYKGHGVFYGNINGNCLVMPPKMQEITFGLKSGDKDLVDQAYLYAAKALAGMRRWSGKEAIDHAVGATHILRTVAEIGDAKLLAAGLLHDVVEDTMITKEEVAREFGPEIAELVDGVSKLSKALEKEQRDAENLMKLIEATNHDPRIALLKACDNLDNMQDQEVFPERIRRDHSLETLNVYSPLMKAMGIHRLATRLEDNAYKYLYPLKHEKVKEIYEAALAKTEGGFTEIAKNIKIVLKDNGYENPAVEVKKRHISEVFLSWHEGSVEKFEEEIASNPLALNYINIEIRENENVKCYEAMGILRKELYRYKELFPGVNPLNTKIDDYIAFPKTDGYEALQTYFHREGQKGFIRAAITTKRMNDQNRLGIIAHGKEVNFEGEWYRKEYPWLSRLIDLSRKKLTSGDIREIISEQTSRMIVYTTEGKKLEMPTTSSVIDFAFYENPASALRLTEVRINGQKEELDTQLEPNDIVEIICGEEVTARPKWLSFMKTSPAAEELKKHLSARPIRQRIVVGREAVNEEIKKYYLDIKSIEGIKWMDEFIRFVNLKYKINLQGFEELLEAIGGGKLDPVEISNLFTLKYIRKLEKRKKNKEENALTIAVKVKVKARGIDQEGILDAITGPLKELKISIETNFSISEEDSAEMTFFFKIYDNVQRDQIRKILANVGEVEGLKAIDPEKLKSLKAQVGGLSRHLFEEKSG